MKLLPAQYAWIAVWNAVSTLGYILQLFYVSAYPYATFPEARVTKAYIKQFTMNNSHFCPAQVLVKQTNTKLAILVDSHCPKAEFIGLAYSCGCVIAWILHVSV